MEVFGNSIYCANNIFRFFKCLNDGCKRYGLEGDISCSDSFYAL